MDKVDLWRKKMNDYYSNVSREQFIIDLERAGFKVNKSIKHTYRNNCRKDSYQEVACTVDLDEEIIEDYEPVALHIR